MECEEKRRVYRVWIKGTAPIEWETTVEGLAGQSDKQLRMLADAAWEELFSTGEGLEAVDWDGTVNEYQSGGEVASSGEAEMSETECWGGSFEVERMDDEAE